MSSAASLAEGNEKTLDQDVAQHHIDEVVHRSLVLDVKEAPLVERLRVGVQDIGGVLVHVNRATSNPVYLEAGPADGQDHGEDCCNSENDLCGGVTDSKFPEAKDDHLRPTDDDLSNQISIKANGAGYMQITHDSVEDTLEDGVPSIPEVTELVGAHLARLSETFANELED